jgi:hypothetical protein
MSDLRAAHELERLRYLHRIEELNEEERDRVQQIKATAAQKGYLRSGLLGLEITKARTEKVTALIDARIAIRKALVGEVPELGSEQPLDELQAELNATVQNAFSGLRDSFAREVAASGVVADAFGRMFEQETFELQARARREIEMLKREVALNLHKKSGKPASVSVHTGGGHAIVNLGEIYGDVQQVIGNIGESSQGLADVLRRLTEAINAAEQLGDERAAYMEQVRFIAKQAVAPSSDREVGVVKGVLSGLRASLQDVANVATVLVLAGPAIAQHFGFQWPF